MMLLMLFVAICFASTKATDRTAARIRQKPYARVAGLITAAIVIAILAPEFLKH